MSLVPWHPHSLRQPSPPSLLRFLTLLTHLLCQLLSLIFHDPETKGNARGHHHRTRSPASVCFHVLCHAVCSSWMNVIMCTARPSTGPWTTSLVDQRGHYSSSYPLFFYITIFSCLLSHSWKHRNMLDISLLLLLETKPFLEALYQPVVA